MTRDTGTVDQVKLSLFDWVKLAGLIYVPLIAAVGWAISMDSRMAVQQTKMDAIREILLQEQQRYNDLESRLRQVERRP